MYKQAAFLYCMVCGIDNHYNDIEKCHYCGKSIFNIQQRRVYPPRIIIDGVIVKEEDTNSVI